MKIAFVFRNIEKSSNTYYIPKILEYFEKKGHKVEVFAKKCAGLTCKNLGKSYNNVIFDELTTSFNAFLKIRRKKFDIIYSRSPSRYILSDITSLHFIFSLWGNDKFLGKIFSLGERLSFLIKRRYIIAISNLMKNKIRDVFKIEEERIRVIYNGVNTDIFNYKNRKSKEAKEIRKKYMDGFSSLSIFVGARPQRKGLEYLIKAMKHTKDNKLIVVGLGQNDIEKYKKIVNKNNVEEKVDILGFVPHEKLKFYYAASDIFILPTFFDPCAVATLEAMTSGAVPIDSIFNGSAELIKNGYNGFKISNPRKFKEISHYINLLTEDRNLLKKMRKNARKIEKERNLDIVAKEWEEFFGEVYEHIRRGP